MFQPKPFFMFSLISLACSTAFAATPVDLNKQSVSVLKSFINTSASTSMALKEVSRHTDFNQVTHIRVKETYEGHPIWNANAIIHTIGNNTALSNLNSKSTMDGTLFQNLAVDLAPLSRGLATEAQADLALKEGVTLHQKQAGTMTVDLSNAKKELIVYVDKQNKAHWAYFVSFLGAEKNGQPAVPTYILDASTFAVYEAWNNLQSAANVSGGGFGGNLKMGKFSYDGLSGDYPQLVMSRDANKKQCQLKNSDVIVKDDTNASGPFSSAPVASFSCNAEDPQHNNVYWDGEQDAVNGGYSPVNDSLYIGQIVKDMYMKWYNVPVLSLFGMPLKLTMHAHAKDMYGQVMDNAFFFPLTMQMYFGDGVELFYPLTSLGVGGHELSHGFTSQHSNLTYDKQSGGLNESYSDMAAQAAEFFAFGKNSWQIGPEIVKGDGALRYMDDPTKDGKSIAHVKDYRDDLNVHYSSGVFNKAFYLIATTPGWDTKKAFDVMVKANMDYWTADATFANAACGVMKATRDYHYETAAVSSAMNKVGIDVSRC